jgi:hypothetical protein
LSPTTCRTPQTGQPSPSRLRISAALPRTGSQQQAGSLTQSCPAARRESFAAPCGQPVFIKFWLPEQKRLGGEVRYQLERWGIGVEFKGLSAEEVDKLTALVEHYRESSSQ